MKKVCFLLSLLMLCVCLCGCTSRTPARTIKIASGSENRILEPLLNRFEQESGVHVEMTYMGSVEIMRLLQAKDSQYDAVFPANSIWISLGDTALRVKHAQSISTTPVVFGVRKSIAQRLGWIGADVTTRDLLDAIREGELSFAMTSATQSNSGATAYLGFIYALLGGPEIVTSDMLDDLQLQSDLTGLLSGVSRSSGSSDWLRELFLESSYDAMVNYESVLIETNQALVSCGDEPLYILYPKDGLGLADSPLGYIDQGNEQKEADFLALQTFLLSDSSREAMLKLGRRPAFSSTFPNPLPDVFNPEWGIDTERTLNVMRMPEASVIEKALRLYQAELRKPSLTAYCLDVSGSMAGEGIQQVQSAMTMLLDQAQAKAYLLESSARDVTLVIPFDGNVNEVWSVAGNDQAAMQGLLKKVMSLQAGGGTNIYDPVIRALTEMCSSYDLSEYSASIILLTDGRSNRGDYSAVQRAWENYDADVPIFSITFGSASQDQLQELADLTRARVFDGREDLAAAFRSAKGYN